MEPEGNVYEVDPIICPKCGGTMKVVAFLSKSGGEVCMNSAATGLADGSRVARPRAQAVLDVS